MRNHRFLDAAVLVALVVGVAARGEGRKQNALRVADCLLAWIDRQVERR